MESKMAGIYFKIVGRDNGKTSKRELHMICILLMEHEVHDGTLRYVLMAHWKHCQCCVYCIYVQQCLWVVIWVFNKPN
jgi:hypothetical protein